MKLSSASQHSHNLSYRENVMAFSHRIVYHRTQMISIMNSIMPKENTRQIHIDTQAISCSAIHRSANIEHTYRKECYIQTVISSSNFQQDHSNMDILVLRKIQVLPVCEIVKKPDHLIMFNGCCRAAVDCQALHLTVSHWEN